MPHPAKMAKMHEWWMNHFEIIIECGLTKDMIKEIVSHKMLKLREGIDDFLALLHKNRIPTIIISAGTGDMIKEQLKQEQLNYPNIEVIANFFVFNGEGQAIGVQEPIIHSMNKHETEIEGFDSFEKIRNRKNIIIMGDILEDLGMVDGFDYENLISIGFLNEKVDTKLDEFKENFDIVILDDPGLKYPIELLQKIL